MNTTKKKALVLNGSPHGSQGMTGMFAEPFINGLKDGGCTVEYFDVAKMNIKPCLGDLSCWFKPEKGCIQADDMDRIIEAGKDSTIIVLVTPVYVDGMTAQLKTVIDRLVCTAQPFVEFIDGHMRHPSKSESDEKSYVVLISTCGFWEKDNFDPLITHVKAMSKNFKAEFAGALVRPHAGAILPMQKMGMSFDDIFEAARNAGKSLAETGIIPAEYLETVSRDVIDVNTYARALNEHFEKLIEQKSKQ
jgi:multimeric flavodoxin WrbA